MYQIKFSILFFIFSAGLCQASIPAGISYKQYAHNDVNIQVLILDPKKVKIVAVRAQDAGQGLATVENIAKHTSALAAINGGFFRLNKQDGTIGLPAGVLKINNQWHGVAYKPRGALGWDPNTNQVLIDRIQTNSQLLIGNIKMPIHATNKLLTSNKGSLFSDSYTEQLNFNGNMAIEFQGQKVKKIYTQGNLNITGNSYMYSVPLALQDRLQQLKPGDKVKLQINVEPQLERSSAKSWNKMPYIIGGGPVLIKNKQQILDYKNEKLSSKFIDGRYARTAVGILPDNKWVFVVVERNLLNILEEDAGWNLQQLSNYMQELGCVAAINLDGGHSSMMYVQEQFKSVEQKNYIGNNLVNDRMVADALIVLPR